jgi:hypothetical protein
MSMEALHIPRSKKTVTPVSNKYRDQHLLQHPIRMLHPPAKKVHLQIRKENCPTTGYMEPILTTLAIMARKINKGMDHRM